MRRYLAIGGFGLFGAGLIAVMLAPVRDARALSCAPGAREEAELELLSVTIDGAPVSDLRAYSGFTMTLDRLAEPQANKIELTAVKEITPQQADLYGEQYEAR
jgi:hypothetical protein